MQKAKFNLFKGLVFMILSCFLAANLLACSPPHVTLANWSDDTLEMEALQATFEDAPYITEISEHSLTSSNAAIILTNPDRGLRGETYITLGNGSNAVGYPLSNSDPYQTIRDQLATYENDKPQIFQAYVYLTNFNKTKIIDSNAFQQLEKYLLVFKENNIRILLRFAYSTESVTDAAYKYVDAHLNQISEWIKNNIDLFADTVYAVQAGIVGSWGEGHSNKNLKDKYIGIVFEKLFNMLPSRLYLQVRSEHLRNKMAHEFLDTGRIGMHDDYIIGDPAHKWSYYGDSNKNVEDYEMFKTTLNDAEMPWGSAYMDDDPNSYPLNNLDAINVIKQLQLYSINTFSLRHNYIEDTKNPPYSLERWKNIYFTKEDLEDANLIFNPALLVDENNNPTSISAYDYIRYHVGYHLVLSNVERKGNSLEFSVTNYGMVAPLNFSSFCIVERKNSQIKEYKLDSYDKTMFKSGKTVRVIVNISDISTDADVGLKLAIKGGSDVSLRFASTYEFLNKITYIA
ncbi:MAG: DUF4874 domain-containing protein [Christensenellaceae bacterium]|jgi:hypothetical protein|nr:DUF4874 domain-containing protein [Christensenellaceae bacterium]